MSFSPSNAGIYGDGDGDGDGTPSGGRRAPSGSRQGKKKEKPDDKSVKLWLQVAKFSLLSIAIALAALNSLPYLKFASRIWAAAFAGVQGGWWDHFVMRNFLSILDAIVSVALGFLIWSTLQTLQLLPTFVANSRKALQSLIDDSRKAPTININASDNEAVRWLKERYNQLSLLPIYQLRRLRLVSYAVDLAIVIQIYPPRIYPPDWNNLLMLVVTIFMVEVVVEGYYAVSNILNRVASKQNQK